MQLAEVLKILVENFPALIFIFAIFVFASIILSRIVFYSLKFIEKSTANFTASLVQFFVLFSALPFFLWYYNFETNKIWALVAIISTAAALALTNKISDLFSGFFIYLMNYYRIDDKVTLNGVKGRVIEFNAFNTILLTREGDTVTISNGDILAKVVINHTRSGFQRVTLSVPIHNCSNKELLTLTIKQVVSRLDIVIPNSQVDVNYLIVDGQELYDIVFNIFPKYDIQLSKGIVMNSLLKVNGIEEMLQNVTNIKIL